MIESRTTRSFRTALAALPEDVRAQARRAYRLFQADPAHPSLRFKTSWASQLFTVFGSPDMKLERVGAHRDAPRGGSRTAPAEEYLVRLLGVDIYDPNTGELQPSRGKDVAAWFLDQDYNGYTFCISQAFFPANQDA